MSRRPKGLNTYPQMFWDICEKVSSGEEGKVPVAGMSDALSIRQKFYAFRGALAREAVSGQHTAQFVAKIQETLRTSEFVFIDLKQPGFVRFMHRDNQPLASQLKKIEFAPAHMTQGEAQRIAESEAKMREFLESLQKDNDDPLKGRNYG